MSRNSQVSRILRVLQILEAHPKGIRATNIFKQLNDEGYSCVRETIYRDLAALQGAYIPLVNEGSGEGATWRLDSSLQLNAFMTLSYPEILSLFAVRGLMRTSSGNYVLSALQAMFQKIESALGPRAVAALQELSTEVGVKNQPGWFQVVPEDVLNTVHHACSEGHMIQVFYRSLNPQSSAETPRKIGPDGIYFANGGAYLVGREYPTFQRKTYALSRILSVELMTDHYTSEEGFDIGSLFSSQWGVLSVGRVAEVRLRVTEPLASFLEERFWHSSQKITRLSKGEILFEAQVNLNDEFVRWVLSLGAAAQIEGPPELSAKVHEIASVLAERYSRKTA